MSPIKKRIIFFFLMYSFVISFSYISGVLADRYIDRKGEVVEKTYEMLREIEEYRSVVEDEEYRRNALKKGYQPLFYPDLLRGESDYKRLALVYEVAPLGPQPNSYVYYCNEGNGLLMYRTDRFGFRNNDSIWDEQVGTFVIGDSFVHGACVPDSSETITGYLSEELSVANLGTSSNGPIHYAAIAKTFIPKFKPKVVIMIFYPNDNVESRADNEDSIYFSHYWERPSNSYFARKNGRIGLSENLIQYYIEAVQLLKKSVLNGMTKNQGDTKKPSHYDLSPGRVRQIAERYVPFFGGLDKNNLKLSVLRDRIFSGRQERELNFSSKLAIDTLSKICVTSECTPLIAYIPNSQLWRPDARAAWFAKKLHEYALKRGISFINTTSALRRYDDSEVYAVKGPHLSAKGYKVVAELLADELNELITSL